MTKEENCIYLLVKNVLAKSENFHEKLPKTMITVRWVKYLKEQLTRRYRDLAIDVYNRTDKHWHSIVLCGKILDQAVKYMLIREITAQGSKIVSNPDNLPYLSYTDCMNDVEWMLNDYLPSRFKNQGFID